MSLKTNRRDFLKTFGVATVCACTGMAGMNACSMIRGVSQTPVIPEGTYALEGNLLTFDLEMIDCLQETGGSGKLSLMHEGDEVKLLIIHHESGSFKAFSDRCTHAGRELNYQHGEEKIQCSSFGKATYGLNGRVKKGPAEGPLAIYPAVLKENQLIINIS